MRTNFLNIYKNSNWWIFILLPIVFSCSTEKRIAKSIVNSKDSIEWIVQAKPLIFKENAKLDIINNLKIIDTTITINSIFGSAIQDTALTNLFMEAFYNEIKFYNVKLSSKKTENNHVNTYIINIVQLTFEESITSVYDSVSYSNGLFYNSQRVNLYTLHQWIEVNKNNGTSDTIVLYKNNSTKDFVIGKFKYNNLTNNLDYNYKKYEVNAKDIDNLVLISGATSAEYLYDYILNDILSQKLSKNIISSNNIKYKRLFGSFKRNAEEKFNIIK